MLKRISDKEIFTIGHNELDYVHTTPNSQIILDKFLRENERLFNQIADAQLQSDKNQVEELRGLLKRANKRDVGGINPEWAFSNKDYESILKLMEE